MTLLGDETAFKVWWQPAAAILGIHTPCLLHLLACKGSLWAHCVMQMLIILPCLRPNMIGTMRSV